MKEGQIAPNKPCLKSSWSWRHVSLVFKSGWHRTGRNAPKGHLFLLSVKNTSVFSFTDTRYSTSDVCIFTHEIILWDTSGVLYNWIQFWQYLPGVSIVTGGSGEIAGERGGTLRWCMRAHAPGMREGTRETKSQRSMWWISIHQGKG